MHCRQNVSVVGAVLSIYLFIWRVETATRIGCWRFGFVADNGDGEICMDLNMNEIFIAGTS